VTSTQQKTAQRMTEISLDAAAPVAMPEKAQPRQWHRHALAVRVTHWINALAILFLLMTGFNIFNAHPGLYWGQYGADDDDARRAAHASPLKRSSCLGAAGAFCAMGRLATFRL
jgi:hypothetical protein